LPTRFSDAGGNIRFRTRWACEREGYNGDAMRPIAGWIVVTDKEGNRLLQMRWAATIARESASK